MELLTSVFQRHPPALRLHRELTIALADGDSARAADLASVLATTVQRVVAAEADSSDAATPPEGHANTGHFSQRDIPVAGLEDVEEAVEKTRQTLLREATVRVSSGVARDTGGSAISSEPAAAERSLPFWRDPERLCVTILESMFETEVLGGESQDTLTAAGNRAAEHEAEQVRILDAYLDKEGARWNAQKAAIAKIVLDVTRSLGLTPEDLQAFEGISASAGAGAAAAAGERKLNVLRHSNLVIRGEMPSAPLSSTASECVAEGVETELRALEERMSSLGQPLTPWEVRMARYELQMSKSKMRYVVGVHKELQLALDHSAALRASLREKSTAEVTFTTGTEVFMAEVIRALNEGADAYSANVTAEGAQLTVSNVKAREAVESPVLPFTFMLKGSLWFTTAPSRPPSSSSD
ncbi:conserved hypothetical protein [Leishmania major strain Friedlin]|uniref:Uncharacterized protein n=1 Tax=Leishmania major TaxID=5664 RepID=Q4Q1S8_LEIMA|nr:conserved hypothetical protein [Leishmania major strain Friedlin]CAG9583668.1 hypothetical_protein_-_conserved [Leishmania major strain Friedlin]CAJ09101.1 conserved hypothetical protein [Leishmania major strain Friedlin]|eukprot:XP_001686720.1 conserved hypothetical protein [Leishmania major strain Friedlin]